MNSKKIMAAVAACIISGSSIPFSTVAFAEEAASNVTAEETSGVAFTANNYGSYIEITGYKGTDDYMEIPSEYEGIPVTSIAVLEGEGAICTLKIPASITSIAEGAFDNVTNLAAVEVAEANEKFSSAEGVLYNKDKTELILYPYAKKDTAYTIPDSVVKIAKNAITSSLALEELTVGNGIEEITAETVTECLKIKKLGVSASVKTIDTAAIAINTSIEEYIVDENNEAYSSVDGVLFNKDKTELICYPAEKAAVSYAVPETVTAIADNAFKNAKLATVTVPDSVAVIGNGAFSSMNILATVVLGNGIKEISENAFAGDKALISVVLGSEVTAIKDNAFLSCDSLKSITIPAKVSEISAKAFAECTLLADISVSEQNETFSSIDGVLLDKSASTLIKYPVGKTAAVYDVPDSIETIADKAFENCTAIKKVVLGNSFAEFEGAPFIGCTSLEDFEVAAENENFVAVEGVLLSKDETKLVKYPCGRAAAEYSVPDSVAEIAVTAFSDAANITAFKVSDDNENLSAIDGVVYSKDATVLVKYPSASTRDYYEVAETVESVLEAAFENTSKLEGLLFANDEIQIADNACINTYVDMVIYGNTDSAAHVYAQSADIEFIALDGVYMFGDVNGDGVVNAIDASSVLTVYAQTSTGHRCKYIDAQITAADINMDGLVNAVDASKILTYYAYSATNEEPVSIADFYEVEDPTIIIE